MYPTQLSGAQVAQLYGLGLAGNAATCTTPACCPTACTLPTPAAYWKLDDDPNATVPDAVGSNNGINQNGCALVSGKVGAAAEFVDSSDQISIADSPNLKPTTSLTVAAWVARQSSQSSGPIFAKFSAGVGYKLSVNTTGAAEFSVGSTVASAQGISLSPGQWYHVAGVWDGATTKLYIDGQLQAPVKTGPTTFSHTGAAAVLSGAGGTIGAFKGSVDEVVLFDKALTAAQIAALHALGVAGKSVLGGS